LLQLIREAGHPDELNQTELGEKYGVSQQQISKDLRRIGASVRRNLDADRRALAVDAAVQRAIRGLLEDGDWYKAGQLALDWDEWVADSDLGTAGDGQGDDDHDISVVEALSPEEQYAELVGAASTVDVDDE
jgi:hypothetical protein